MIELFGILVAILVIILTLSGSKAPPKSRTELRQYANKYNKHGDNAFNRK